MFSVRPRWQTWREAQLWRLSLTPRTDLRGSAKVRELFAESHCPSQVKEPVPVLAPVLFLLTRRQPQHIERHIAMAYHPFVTDLDEIVYLTLIPKAEEACTVAALDPAQPIGRGSRPALGIGAGTEMRIRHSCWVDRVGHTAGLVQCDLFPGPADACKQDPPGPMDLWTMWSRQVRGDCYPYASQGFSPIIWSRP